MLWILLNWQRKFKSVPDHTINCFLQVNVSGEESKHGFSPEELDTVLKQIENLDKICIVGLMTMAPIDADAQELDKIFAETNELRESIQEKKLKNVPCDQLSMGMSRDYDMAYSEWYQPLSE